MMQYCLYKYRELKIVKLGAFQKIQAFLVNSLNFKSEISSILPNTGIIFYHTLLHSFFFSVSIPFTVILFISDI